MLRSVRLGPAFLFTVLLAVFMLHVDPAQAWGAAGHSVIAEIAQRRLTPAAEAEVRLLLGSNVSLASVSSWADSVVLLQPETFNLHFVNIPTEATAYDPARDCPDTPRGDCVINAVDRYQAALADKTQTAERRRTALKFLIHFVGDLHQPLHCANRGDAGGSLTPVRFFGASTTLHQVWDVGLIEHHSYDWGGFVNELEQRLAARVPTDAFKGTPRDWAWESHRIAVDVAYDIPDDRQLGAAYANRAFPAVEDRLTMAGMRLAHLINEALDPAFRE